MSGAAYLVSRPRRVTNHDCCSDYIPAQLTQPQFPDYWFVDDWMLQSKIHIHRQVNIKRLRLISSLPLSPV